MDNGKEDLLHAPFAPDGVERQLGELPQEITDCEDRQIAAHGGEPASTGCRLLARRWAGTVVQVWRGHCHQNQPRNLSHQPGPGWARGAVASFTSAFTNTTTFASSTFKTWQLPPHWPCLAPTSVPPPLTR